MTHADALARNALNEVLGSSGAAPLAGLADLFGDVEQMLCTLPELDHYGSRGAAAYWGPCFETQSGTQAEWPAGKGKRVLAYLHAALPQLDAFDPRIAFASRAFAQRNPAYLPADRRRLMALRIEQILGAQPILSRSPTSQGPEK